MWKNPVTQDNLTRLRRLAHQMVEPEEGWMACREHGPGRMADPVTILQKVTELIGHPQDLADLRVMITAGRTEEPIDPVRVLSNRSSGKMGVALAEEALSRGAKVTLLAGVLDVPVPEGVTVERVVTAREMSRAAQRLFPQSDVLIMAAAVGDFRVAEPRTEKIHRKNGELHLDLVNNPDILAALAKKRKSSQTLVGFALETDPSDDSVRDKLRKKGVDLLVVNAPADSIGGDSSVVSLLEPRRAGRKLPQLPKREVAKRILDWVQKHRSSPRKDQVERTAR
jgi:phosphopantothenoylcysteine decarboxylase/phosphopantothenate--cysteine ligase